MSASRIQQTLIALSKQKQANISTPTLIANHMSFTKLNATLNQVDLGVEDDAAEIGSGNEFAKNTFKTAWNVSGALDKYTSDLWAAFILAYGLGNVVKTGTTPNFVYTCTPIDTTASGIELPYFDMIEQLPGLDRQAVGLAIEEWNLSITSGAGRQNCKLTAQFVGSGIMVDPSGLTIPAATAENILPAASVAFSAIGVDYVASKQLVSLSCGIKNNLNLNDGLFPGSGFQTGGDTTSGAVRGRIELGIRQPNLKFVARFDASSLELVKRNAQTTGTVTINLPFNANRGLLLTWQKVAFKMTQLGPTGNLVTVSVDAIPEYDATNGLLTAVVKCGVDGICQ